MTSGTNEAYYLKPQMLMRNKMISSARKEKLIYQLTKQFFASVDREEKKPIF